MKAINLGLSVMWGDCNIGANECYQNGILYTWNEIMPEIDTLSALHAPVAISSSMKCDIAERMYGSGWQVPTKEHLIELMQNCDFEFIPAGTTRLLKATGPNGNSIYLPLAGNEDWNSNKAQGGFYWSSTKAIEEKNHAYQLRIADQIILGYNKMQVRQSVRPVYRSQGMISKKNYNKVTNPIHYTKADHNYIIGQITRLCNEFNIPYSLTEIRRINHEMSQKIPMIDYTQTLKLTPHNALGHGNVTFFYLNGQKLKGMLIEKATKEYIESVKDCGLVYGVILGVGSITYGSDLRTDTIIKLKPDEIYVRLY